MITCDLHTHSFFSSDSRANPEDMLSHAERLGLTTLCITDHFDPEYQKDNPGDYTFIFDPKEYFKHMGPLKEATNGLLKYGIEFGMRPGRKDLNELMHSIYVEYPFDHTLGSIHLLNDKDPFYENFWEGKTVHDVMKLYFDTMYASITEFNDYDTLAHFDYICRYIPKNHEEKSYNYEDHKDVIDGILSHIIKKDKALEINTKGIYSTFGSIHPIRPVLMRYKELGGKLITVGSDAHTPNAIGGGLMEAEELLRSCGFRSVYTFDKHKPIEQAI